MLFVLEGMVCNVTSELRGTEMSFCKSSEVWGWFGTLPLEPELFGCGQT